MPVDRGRSRRQIGPNLAVGLSVLGILALTLFPTHQRRHVHLIPFGDIVGAFGPPIDRTRLLGMIANFFLFLPLGGALRWEGLSIRAAVLAACCLSTAVEITQWLVVPGRTTTVDDVLLNSLGALCGYVLARAAVARWNA
jgi:glycopeptide antibiotics resistance protein